MIQHFRQAKMLLRNDSLHKSLHFSKSFKVFHCSVINVLLLSSAVSLSDSLFIIAPLSSFVNNFFHLFQKFFRGLPPGSLLPVSLFRFGACRLISDSFVILSCPAYFVNSFFYLFLIYYFLNTIDAGLPAMLPVHSVHRRDESPLSSPLHQDRLSVKYMSQIQVLLLLPLSVPPY